MKLPWVLIGSAALTFAASHLAYVAGQQKQRDFEAMCSEPGVRCVVEFSPEYLMTHRGIAIPRSIVGEFAEDDGGMR